MNIELGECTEENWISKITPIIEERMQRFNSIQTDSSEIRFNLMAIVQDRRVQLEEKIKELDTQFQSLQKRLHGLSTVIFLFYSYLLFLIFFQLSFFFF